MENCEIKNSKCQKLLGIKIDSKLTFDYHVTDICNKVSQKLHALSQVSHLMTLVHRKKIMNVFILSQFGYCPLAWMFHSRTLSNSLFIGREEGPKKTMIYMKGRFVLFIRILNPSLRHSNSKMNLLLYILGISNPLR